MTTVAGRLHVPGHVATVHALEAVAVGTGLLLGGLAWWHQLDAGLVVTGLGDVVPWGLYTAASVAFSGLASGALLVAAVSANLSARGWSDLARPAAATSLAAVLAAVAAVVVGTGRPERVQNLLLHPNWSAPLVWSVYALLACGVLAALLLTVSRRHLGSMTSRAVSALAATAALALPVLTGAVFALPVGRPAWNTGLVLPTFLVAAVVAGAAVAVLAGASGSGQRAWRDRAVNADALLAAGQVTLLVVTGLGYLTGLNGAPGQVATTEVVLPGGRWGGLFWAQWVAGGAVLLLLAVPRLRGTRPALTAAACLALVSVATAYLAVVPAGLAVPPIMLPPGVPVGAGPAGPSFAVLGSYVPTLTEYGVVLGVVSVFAAALLLLRRHRTGEER